MKILEQLKFEPHVSAILVESVVQWSHRDHLSHAEVGSGARGYPGVNWGRCFHKAKRPLRRLDQTMALSPAALNGDVS